MQIDERAAISIYAALASFFLAAPSICPQPNAFRPPRSRVIASTARRRFFFAVRFLVLSFTIGGHHELKA
jgi:hypothetical protein